jgi:hypothetical protein
LALALALALHSGVTAPIIVLDKMLYFKYLASSGGAGENQRLGPLSA